MTTHSKPPLLLALAIILTTLAPTSCTIEEECLEDECIVSNGMPSFSSFMENLTQYDYENQAQQNDPDELIENKTSVNDSCVGERAFCNYTLEEYIAMLDDYIFPQTYEWILIASHMVVFLVGLVGNALVCVAVYRNHSMRTVTNYFIVNLAVADFMVILFCLPPTVLWDVTETWFFGNAMCRIVLYFQVSLVFYDRNHCSFEKNSIGE